MKISRYIEGGRDVVLFFAFLLFFLSLLISAYAIFFGYDIYPVNWFVQLRIFFVFSLVGSCAGVLVFDVDRRRNNRIFAIAGMYVFAILYILVVERDVFYLLSASFVFVFIFVFEIYVDRVVGFVNSSFALYLSYLILIFAVASPLLVGNYINYESSFNYSVAERFGAMQDDRANVIDVDFPLNDYPLIHQTIESYKSSGVYYNPLPIVETLYDNHYRLSFPIGDDLSMYCVFSSDRKCDSILKQSSTKTIFQKRAYLASDIGCRFGGGQNISNTLRQGVYYVADQHGCIAGGDKIRLELIKGIDEYLEYYDKLDSASLSVLKLMMTRGLLSHHYSYIWSGVQDGVKAFNNQYGLGPAMVVHAIAGVFDISLFDSIYYSILVGNLLVAILVFVFFRDSFLVVLSAASAILVVFLAYNIIAPYLYFIRYFPVFLLLAVFFMREFTTRRQWANALLYVSFGVVGVYNKEYALLISVASAFVFVVAKEVRYLLYTFLLLLPSLFFLLIDNNEGSSSAANLAALFSGVGIEGIFTLPVFLWFVLLIFCSVAVYLKSRCSPQYSEILFFLSLVFVLSAKVAWIGSTNHIGPLLLVFSLEIIYFQRVGVLDLRGRLSLRVIQVCLLSVFISIPGVVYLRYLSNISGGTYGKLPISDHFFISSELVDKANSLGKFGDIEYFLFSKQDDFLNMVEASHRTGRLHNVSTQINHPSDVGRVIREVDRFNYLVVDKELLDNNIERYLIRGLYNRNARLNDYIKGYIIDVHAIRYLLDRLFQSFHPVGGNEHFVLFQRNV